MIAELERNLNQVNYELENWIDLVEKSLILYLSRKNTFHRESDESFENYEISTYHDSFVWDILQRLVRRSSHSKEMT